MLLAGDIGGTKTNLAIYDPEQGIREPLFAETFPSGNFPTLEALVRKFLESVDAPITRVCFGVAGPVVGGRATITNLPWVLDEHGLRRALGVEAVFLINDLTSIAYAVPFLEQSDFRSLNEGRPVPGGAIAVIAPGTGLGEAFLTWGGAHYLAHPSEGGHADFAPVGDTQIEMLTYLKDKFEHVSYERICSGMGLPNIYAFLRDTGRYEEPPWLAEALAKAKDPTPEIVNAALDKERECALCRATLDIFVSVLGSEAGNLALKVLSTGGIFLGGGIPPRILAALEHGQFMNAFLRKGRLSHLLAPMPVAVILNSKAPLLGAAHYALEAD
ncbi:MAG: glucokinase [Anaerolineae bacterium]|nr:glucokinase [Anaerolineae bacterium]